MEGHKNIYSDILVSPLVRVSPGANDFSSKKCLQEFAAGSTRTGKKLNIDWKTEKPIDNLVLKNFASKLPDLEKKQQYISGGVGPLFSRRQTKDEETFSDSLPIHISHAMDVMRWFTCIRQTVGQKELVKDMFYECLYISFQKIHKNDKIVVFGNFNPRAQNPAHPVKSKNGLAVIRDLEGIVSRWAKQFKDLLNCVNLVNPTFIEALQKLPTVAELDNPRALMRFCRPPRK
ncbi:hypothetical protein HELRODRAFT_172789 [Helobdella robusta]|uniref:Uncharacterized protein n=1 Tax=Helobdella robusta TaxID=6412 RepID=T1F5Y3_HELRO|nr:hypothetical protein HELRODRAFT_172789 [Helobdella robusta]ESO04407.1 hypothetical protein HELRODRAFT_172789 [Helobdella robusta]